MENTRFKTFAQFLFEGGNARVIDRKTGKIIARAEKIDLKKFKRSDIVDDIVNMLAVLNEKFEDAYDKKIWSNFEVVRSGKAFSGSTEFFFDLTIPDDEFVKHKPSVGDIDVIIPKNVSEDFEEFMPTIEGEKLLDDNGAYIKYLGQDRADFGTTWLAVFEYTNKNASVNFQIDFEYGDWDDKEESPSNWAKFSHNSSWEDISKGLKGVHHKYLLINLARALSKKDDIVIATPSSTPDKVKLVGGKKGDQTPRLLAFSVDRGLRIKYKQMEDDKGNPVEVDGKLVFQEIPTASSDYIKNVPDIYAYIFGEEPTSEDLKDFNSFVGLAKIIKKKVSKENIEETFNFLLNEALFGKRAQILEKNNPELDAKVKWAMVNKLYEIFPYLKDREKEVEDMSTEYYSNFKMEKDKED
jgi:hypothetical protein